MEEIKADLQKIQSFLETPLSENPESVLERGNELGVHLARTGKMLADAKAEYNAAITSEVMAILKSIAQDLNASHTAVNALIKAACKREQYIVDWAERLNKTCARQLDWCRSVLSKAKEEYRFTMTQSNI